MRTIAINASPRPNWNTAQILQAALDEAARLGHQTALIHLYEHTYTGCRSCFACKRPAPPLGYCAIKDDLSPILAKILAADVLLLGSPIYFGDVTGQLRALLERLWFPSLNYDKEHTVNYPLKTPSALILTMNVPNGEPYNALAQQIAATNTRLVGPTQTLMVCDTQQFADYSQYFCTMFDAQHKIQHHEQHFPQDKQAAAQLMNALLEQAAALKL